MALKALTGALSFPNDIDVFNNGYMKFVAYSWAVIGKRDLESNIRKNIEATIILPFPANGLIDDISINWEEVEGLASKNAIEVGAKTLSKAVKDATGMVGQFAQYQTGITTNDFASLTFNDVNFRTHSFEYKLLPQSYTDAFNAFKILDQFKKSALGERNGFLLDYPNFWQIEIGNPANVVFFNFKTCIIESITPNYLPNDTTPLFKDGYPPIISFTINFKEIERLRRSDIPER